MLPRVRIQNDLVISRTVSLYIIFFFFSGEKPIFIFWLSSFHSGTFFEFLLPVQPSSRLVHNPLELVSSSHPQVTLLGFRGFTFQCLLHVNTLLVAAGLRLKPVLSQLAHLEAFLSSDYELPVPGG